MIFCLMHVPWLNVAWINDMVVWVRNGDPDTWLCGTRFENRPQRIKQDTCPGGIRTKKKDLNLTRIQAQQKHYCVCFSNVLITASKTTGDCAYFLVLAPTAPRMTLVSGVPAGNDSFSNSKSSCSWIELRSSELTVNVRWRVWKANLVWK
jgi:hypothetical protein